MINIQNKEKEHCAVLLVDMRGRVQYETRIAPEEYLNLDISPLLRGIYTLIFQTSNTQFVQRIVKYT